MNGVTHQQKLNNKYMRTIKFRAWDKDNKQLFPVGILGFCEGGISVSDGYSREAIGKYELMQFTGLHDKNGKEIYEGDILKLTDTLNVEVKWSDKFGGFTTSEEGTAMFGSHLAEVIGNIYENPNLIK